MPNFNFSCRNFAFLFLPYFLIIQHLVNNVTCQTLPTVTYKPPNMTFDASSTITLPSSDTAEIQVNNYYIARRSLTGGLIIWDTDNYTKLFELFNGSSYWNTKACISFAFNPVNPSKLAVITSTKQILVISLDLDTKIPTLLSNFTAINASQTYKIKITLSQIAILTKGFNSICCLQTFKMNGSLVGSIDSVFSQKFWKMTTCAPPSSAGTYYSVGWMNDCYFELWVCNVGIGCSFYSNYSSPNCSALDYPPSTNETNVEIKFNSDCSQMIFQQKLIGARVFNIQTKSFVKTYNTYSNRILNITYNISEMVFLDSQGIYMGLVTVNGSFLIYQTNPANANPIYNGSISPVGALAEYSVKNGMFVIANGTSMYTYRLSCSNSSLTITTAGLCLLCPANCNDCDINGSCLNCRDSFVLNSTSETCVLQSSTVENNSLTVPNATDNNTPNVFTQNSTTPSQNNLPENQTTTNSSQSESIENPNTTENNSSIPSNTTNSLQPENKLTVEPIYSYEQQVGKFVHEEFLVTVINSAIVSINILQILPFSFLFMRFINFWFICSFYLLTLVKLPLHLYMVLDLIYQGINQSLLESIGIKIQINDNVSQKTTGNLNQKYQISFDFLNFNIENFIVLAFSYAILLILYLLTLWLKDGLVKKILSKINFPLAFLGQYAGIMNSFFIHTFNIQNCLVHRNFNQKFNIVLHLIFIAFSSCTYGVFLKIIANQTIQQKKKHSSQERQEMNTLKNQWLINFMSNSIVPATAIYGRNQMFLFACAVTFAFQIYTAYKSTSFRLNNIILALHVILFEAGFCILVLCDPEKYSVLYHHTGFCLIFVLFIGATHQMLTFVFGLIYNIYHELKYIRSSVKNEKIIRQKRSKIKTPQTQYKCQSICYESQATDIKNIHFSPIKITKKTLENKQHRKCHIKIQQIKDQRQVTHQQSEKSQSSQISMNFHFKKKNIHVHAKRKMLKLQILNLSLKRKG